MTKQVEAVYEQGRLRPLEPLGLPEGTRLRLILVTRDETSAQRTPAELLSEIAALPLEGEANTFSGRDHDSVLYKYCWKNVRLFNKLHEKQGA
jgi:predicted DNA-binding antitoxin AbrB/MazE fold protein